MRRWVGSSGVCVNDAGELLMVLQGKPGEKKTWSVPSGEQEPGESFEECCIRETKEETGYHVEVVEELKVKRISLEIPVISVEVHYFKVSIVGGERKIADPDNLIHDVAWKSIDDLQKAVMTFPEDRVFLIDLVKKKISN